MDYIENKSIIIVIIFVIISIIVVDDVAVGYRL